jgi:hypothetical protein
VPLDDISASTAENVIEQLRYGIPAQNMVRQFTVGRDHQIDQLLGSLLNRDDRHGRALLLRANYGAGKSHLLRVVREMALENNFAVSYIVADANQGVRFNRMDTILGAVTRSIETPGCKDPGVQNLFDAYMDPWERNLTKQARDERSLISNKDRWDFSDHLRSASIFVALRAWMRANSLNIRDRIVDWLGNPDVYKSQRKLLYAELVGRLSSKFRDRRMEWQFYADDVFSFHTTGHQQSWAALGDYHMIAKCSGLRGLVLLIDEFEDVIQNLNRRDFQQAAFYNLFLFFAGRRFPSKAYFAVTPDFASKCKKELLRRGVYDFDYSNFDTLPYFQLDPLTPADLLSLSERICKVHSIAYGWDAFEAVTDEDLKAICELNMLGSSPDRIRSTIKAIVEYLDDKLESTE